MPLLTTAFAGRDDEHQVKRLLADTEFLLAWQRNTPATNPVRVAMEKVAGQWNVRRWREHLKRKPAEIAEELEGAILAKARRMLDRSTPFGSAEQPAFPEIYQIPLDNAPS